MRQKLLVATLAAASVLTLSCVGWFPAATASAAGPGVIINEFYGRGGSTGQPYTNKFVELYNSSDAAVALDGMSLQYRSATGTAAASAVAALKGSIAAHGYFLVQLNSNGTAGAALPTPDQVTTLTPSGTTGTVFLAKGTTAINPGSGSALDPNVVDLLGYGTSNTYEGAVAAYPGSNTTVGSLARSNFADTDNNAADFAVTTDITPQNSTTAPAPGGTPTPTPTPTPTASPTTPGTAGTSIADIQGTGATSPLAGQTVTTTGVVTASYPTGGFNGYYIQTPGSGGSARAAGQASDGVFVYSSTAQPVGACVSVTGKVSEFNGLTEITPTGTTPQTGCAPVVPSPFVAAPHSAGELEAYEGMLVSVQGAITVTNNYTTNTYGTVGLAFGTEPLRQATDVVAPAEAAAYEAANKAREFTLDDGSSWNYMTNATAKASPLPYLTAQGDPRVGAAVTFTKPVIVDYRYNAWAFQPQGQVKGQENSPITVTNDREQAPAAVGGNVSVATFNVLNYFTDLGKDEAGCQGYLDRDGVPVAANGCLVRGAYTQQAFDDQQAKIVTAILGLKADVVGLEEIENSANFGHDRDAALANLVDALNARYGSPVWAYVKSPATRPAVEDVIRTAFIYRWTKVRPIGDSVILDDVAFKNARQPLAQKFRTVRPELGGPFVVVANHFKSKGSAPSAGSPDYDGNIDTGQGNWNLARVNQAKALTAWAAQWNGLPTFLIGDFNAYAKEDPVQVITGAGYTDLVPALTKGETTYQFSGRIGSLDHVFANAKAMAQVSGATVWDINADEPVALQYSRKNYNVSPLFTPDQFAASDHDPIKVGLTAPRR